MGEAKQERRRLVLAIFVRRAVYGMRAQRDRLLTADAPAGYDLDFYAYAAHQLREAIERAMARADLREELAPILSRLDAEVPHLGQYRNAMAHALEQKIGEWFWFGTDVTRGLPGGEVEWLIDARDHHAVFESVAEAVLGYLDPESTLDERFGSLSESRPAPFDPAQYPATH